MPLLITPEFEQDLRELRTLSPEVAALAERIALAVRPEATASGAWILTYALFELMHALALRWEKSVREVGAWLGDLRVMSALTAEEVEGFKGEVRRLGGAEGAVE